MISEQTDVNAAVLARFAAFVRHGRLAHAYLFIGPPGSGKEQTALAVARQINCEQPDPESNQGCGTCPSCRKISSGNHPDVTVIGAEDGQAMKIAQVRELLTQSHLRPYEAKKKVFILRNTEQLTVEGSNALLKTLEEPPASSLLILTTSAAEDNLATIRSRCHAVRFYSASPSALAANLRNQDDLDLDSAHFLAYYAEGCAGRARRLREEDFFRRKNEMIDNMVFQRNNEPYMKGVLADPSTTREVLAVLLSWFRDLALCKTGRQPERLIHQDREADLRDLDTRYSAGQVFAIIDEIVATIRLLNENLNVKIAFYVLREKIWLRS